MRSHEQIIRDAAGYAELARRIGQPVERVRFWERRKSIPTPYWAALTGAGLATFEELIAGAANRGRKAA